MNLRKKHITISLGLAILVAGGVGTAAILNSLPPAEKKAEAIHSDHNRISLKDLKAHANIKSTSPIAGTYKAEKDQALVYSVTDEKNKLLAGGTILPDESGSFSRNLAFIDTPEDNATVTLKISAQNKKGEAVDSLSLPLTYTK